MVIGLFSYFVISSEPRSSRVKRFSAEPNLWSPCNLIGIVQSNKGLEDSRRYWAWNCFLQEMGSDRVLWYDGKHSRCICILIEEDFTLKIYTCGHPCGLKYILFQTAWRVGQTISISATSVHQEIDAAPFAQDLNACYLPNSFILILNLWPNLLLVLS